jgi:hypothetical protein
MGFNIERDAPGGGAMDRRVHIRLRRRAKRGIPQVRKNPRKEMRIEER